MQQADDVTVEIAPQLSGHITPRGLIEPRGTIEFATNYRNLTGSSAGYLCKIVTKEFHLEIGRTSSEFYIVRNSDLLKVPLRPTYGPTGEVHVFASWDQTELTLTVLDDNFKAAIAKHGDQADKVREVESRRVVLPTLPTMPPNSLLRWARKQAILPTTTYSTAPQLYAIVTSSLEAIQDSVVSEGSVNAFWDIMYDGSTIVQRRPKRETDIHPTIHNLLYYIAIAKNLEVTREYPVSAGRLDFLFSGPLIDGETANVCVEFKHAHSNDLMNGMLKQLPAYMRAKGCDFGIYGVLYFRGHHFQEPHDLSIVELRVLLEKHRRGAGLGNIRTMMFDFSQPRSPSKS